VLGFAFANGIPHYLGSGNPESTSNATFSMREAYLHWWDGQDGKNDYYSIVQPNTLIDSFVDNNMNTVRFKMTGAFKSGSAVFFTYNHKTYDHAPTHPTYDTRVEIDGSDIVKFVSYAEQIIPYDNDWRFLSEHDAHLIFVGWWE
jgi:hypothetical protein